MRPLHRVLVVVLGVVVLLVGLAAWSIEDEYGSGTNFFVEMGTGPQGIWTVYNVDEQAGSRRLVFEGSRREAEAYMEQTRAAGESFVIPGMIIASGAVLFLAGLIPWPRPGRPSSTE